MIKDRLLVESFFSQKKMFKSKAYRSIENFKEESKNEGSYTSIFHQYSLNNNIFHWYIECLPRLHLLAYIQKPITILCPSNLLAYQLRQIETLSSKYSNVKIELINEDTVYKIKNYVFLSFLNNIRSGYLPKFALDYYTELVPKSNNLTTKKRLFIDRHLNKARNIVNKNEVEELLKKNNFEILCLEELEPEKQMSFLKT
ncbi:MAG: glycosyltransferase family 61 protein [Ignavibacteria bacterium]|nr:glycosyltransferase family 61 protein [Ignavibacteria bacterium]